jgi:hypothetical protein
MKKSNAEIENLKAKIELKDSEDEKHMVRDKIAFEAHFGFKARPSDGKYL